jgi:hypothetical protein
LRPPRASSQSLAVLGATTTRAQIQKRRRRRADAALPRDTQQQQQRRRRNQQARRPAFGGNSSGSSSNHQPQQPLLPYEAQETIYFFGADGSISRVPGRRRVVARPAPSPASHDDSDGDLGISGGVNLGSSSASSSELYFLSPSCPASARAAAGGHLPMPPPAEQGLCVASTFCLQATNGRDPSRRISFEGFVQLPELLEEAVEASVRARGGEVLVRESSALPERLASRLAMRVAVPLLFGVPEEWPALREAIESAGGIVHQVQRSWLMMGGGGGGGAMRG